MEGTVYGPQLVGSQKTDTKHCGIVKNIAYITRYRATYCKNPDVRGQILPHNFTQSINIIIIIIIIIIITIIVN